MRLTFGFAAAAVLGLIASLPAGLAEAGKLASRPDVMTVDKLKRGMKGYGLTVFEGTKPTRFDVEIIDVLKNFRPRQDLILIKTDHPRLDVAKVVAGMSGSPIYVDGKMIGAYAYGWTFGTEPVAGVTPITDMIETLVRPLPKVLDGWRIQTAPTGERGKSARLGQGRPAGSAGETGRPALAKRRALGPTRYRGTPSDYSLVAHRDQLSQGLGQTRGALVTPVATPLLLGGFSAGAVELAKELLSPLGLEPLQAGGGGGSDPTAPLRFEDGGAVGVQLIRGDMSATGLGTVTRVEGDKLVAFGHPMMEAGVTALPTAIGRVLWVLASDQRSFKIGMPVRELGAMVADRQAAIVVSHSARAPVIPVNLSIQGVPGAPHEKWSFEVAHEKFMTPAFMAIALGSAVQATAAERRDVSWTAKSTLKIRDHGEVVFEDFGVSVGGTPEAQDFARSNLVGAVGGILNNPWEPVILESASMRIEFRYAREILRLRGAEVLEPEVEAGKTARVRLHMEPFAGPDVVRVVTFPVPEHLAGETLTIEITPGYTEEREVADPENLADLIRNLEDPVYPAKSVVLSYETSSSAVAYRGRVARHLPPGVVDALRPQSSSVAPDAFQTTVRHVVPLPQYLVGTDKVSLTVKPVLR